MSLWDIRGACLSLRCPVPMQAGTCIVPTHSVLWLCSLARRDMHGSIAPCR